MILTPPANRDNLHSMTTTEIEIKTRSFADSLNKRELCKAASIIEDILDERAFDRSIVSNFKTTPLEEVEARLIKKFGPELARRLA